MYWIVENFHYIFLFFVSALCGYFYAINRKKNKPEIGSDGFPISPVKFQRHFNQLDKQFYIFVDEWKMLKRVVIANVGLEVYYNDKTGNHCVDVVTYINGIQETNTFWGDTEEQAISKACCSINQILLDRFNQ